MEERTELSSAEMLMEVRRLWMKALRASRARCSCTGVADCCRFRLTGETPHVTLGEADGLKVWRAAGRTRVFRRTEAAHF
ncbi:MAG: hypothetical protein ACLT8E_09710 [Akkermansia sp.]